jgi:hypothetical protein
MGGLIEKGAATPKIAATDIEGVPSVSIFPGYEKISL